MPIPAFKPKRKGKIIAVIVIVLVVIAAVFAAYWFLWKGEKEGKDEVTYLELWQDYNIFTSNFESYDSGDTVYIKDEISKIEYNESLGKTAIWFKSVEGTYLEDAHPFI